MTEKSLLKRKSNYISKGNSVFLAGVCNELAELYKREGKYELAIEEYKNEARVYKEMKKYMLYAQVNRMIGEIYTTLAEFDKALEHEQIHLDIATDYDNELEQQRALATLGRIYLTKAITKNSDTETLNLAEDTFVKSLNICERLNNLSKIEHMDMKARLFLNIGVVKEHQGHFDESIDYMQKSIQICNSYDIYDQLHHGYNTLGLLYSRKEDASSNKIALNCFNNALDIASRLSDKIPALCSSYTAKAEVLIKSAEFQSAKYTLLKAYKLNSPDRQEKLTIEQNLKIVAKMCQTEETLLNIPENNYKKRKELYEIMGDGTVYLKSFKNAINYYNKMLECAIACGDSEKDLLPVYISLAQTYKDNKQYKLALDFFEKEYIITRQNQEESFKTLLNVADTLELCNECSYERITKVYDRALKKARSTGKTQYEGKVLSHLIQYQIRMNKREEAEILKKELARLNYNSSDSESENEEETPNIGNDINIEDLSDDLEITNLSSEQRQRRKRGKKFKTNTKGETPLHTACIKGDLNTVAVLVEHEELINTRDNSGWLPIHEACNYGHLDIVKLLISKGASINDRGGIHCGGITPLHDACSNGHLEMIEYMLDHGASALALSDANNSPLDVLKDWRTSVRDLDSESQSLYDHLVLKLTTILKRAGRSFNQNTKPSETIHEEAIVLETPKISPRRSTRTSPRKSPKLLRETALEYSVGNLRYSVDPLDDLDQPSSSKLRRNSSFDSSKSKKCARIRRNSSLTSNKIHTSDSELDNNACKEYKSAIEGLRYRTKEQISKKSPNKARKSAYISSDEADDDWLEDDIGSNGKKRKRHSFSDQIINIDNKENRERFLEQNSDYSSDSTVVSSSSKRRKSQTSLLDSGFSKNKNKSPSVTADLSPVNFVDKITNKLYKRQRKLNNYVYSKDLDGTEPDSTTDHEDSNLILPVVAINVRLDNKLFRIPIAANDVNSLTIGWLAQETTKRYYKQEGNIPTIELLSKEGAILSSDDPLSIVFISPTRTEEVQTRILNWNLPPLTERYSNACIALHIDICPVIIKNLKVCETTTILKLTDFSFKKHQLTPLCRALHRQSDLQHIDLSDNILNVNNIQQFCEIFPSLTQLKIINLSGSFLENASVRQLSNAFCSLPNLRSLNFANNNLTNAAIKYLVEGFSKVDEILLNELNLSFNAFGDKSLLHLAMVTQKVKLTTLNLAGNNFSPNIFQDDINSLIELNLEHLENFDISYNDLNTESIIKFMSFLNFNIVSKLNFSNNENVSETGIVKRLTEYINQYNTNKIKSLFLASCCVIDSEVTDLLRSLANSEDLESLDLSCNCDLTSETLMQILHQKPMFSSVWLFGCKNITQGFKINCAQPFTEINKLKYLKLSLNHILYSKEINYICKMWRNKWGNKSKVYQTMADNICFSM